MCPICWINGFIALLFGASALSFGPHPYWISLALTLIGFGGYKIWQGYRRGKNFTDKQNTANKKSIIRFLIGVTIGLFSGIIIMYALSSAEHQQMHDLLEQHGIEEHEHE